MYEGANGDKVSRARETARRLDAKKRSKASYYRRKKRAKKEKGNQATGIPAAFHPLMPGSRLRTSVYPNPTTAFAAAALLLPLLQ